ncbi:hypothetical protein SAMN02745702_01552 [Desulfobaculum bizertense DSM 18034]|uniref:Uncharacterized protein n=1 Tax=Desulfobaculum bizertense DSM 18034 TaxID=1121442 RepID=A0A1T4W3G3_9BACT|nr:hypothetical protein SAMN02745702_01552 [Desulfobaculum bizertense DSM 18034]
MGGGTRLCLVLCKGRCPLTPPKDEALGNPAIAQKNRLNGMKASLSSPSAYFFELGEFPERVFFCLFCCTYVLSERKRSERAWWQLAKEKVALDASPIKFKSRASEACTAFKLDEDT